jgi:hypothetical protein
MANQNESPRNISSLGLPAAERQARLPFEQSALDDFDKCETIPRYVQAGTTTEWSGGKLE